MRSLLLATCVLCAFGSLLKGKRRRVADPESFLHIAGKVPVTHENGRRNLHLVALPHQGSFVLGEALKSLNVPYVSDGWGTGATHADNFAAVNCVYECTGCEGNVKNEKLFQSVCRNNLVTLKTQQVLDMGVLSQAVSGNGLAHSQFLLVLRDPRGMYDAELKENKFAKPSCESQMFQYLSAKDFVKSITKNRLASVFFEQWSHAVESMVPELLQWAGLENTEETTQVAKSQGQNMAINWKKTLSQKKLDQLMKAPYCQEYMDAVGYPTDPQSPADYQMLKSPFDEDMTEEEVTTLTKLRSNHKTMLLKSHKAKSPHFQVHIKQ